MRYFIQGKRASGKRFLLFNGTDNKFVRTKLDATVFDTLSEAENVAAVLNELNPELLFRGITESDLSRSKVFIVTATKSAESQVA